jgi:predicted 2-oxoglutarate/Fe(II)-dependent dioxygenase YbiX
MKNNIKNLQLKNFIHIERGLIPKDTCRFVIDSIKNESWSSHLWGTGAADDKLEHFSYPTKELDVLEATPDLEDILNPLMSLSIKSYNDFIGSEQGEQASQVTCFSSVRFNRYQKGQTMRIHCDHIRSLFEGEVKGIPVLSIIINFNDDYKGGDLIFWDDYKVDLGEGDVVVFPSLFLFPHRIEEVTENIRYSGVAWGC